MKKKKQVNFPIGRFAFPIPGRCPICKECRSGKSVYIPKKLQSRA